MELRWVLKSFPELTAEELYAIMQLRNEVFVVEQDCVYQDADGKDPRCWHLAGWDGSGLVAYTRLLPPGLSHAEASIGRVVTSPAYRGTGAGRQLMQESIRHALRLYNCSEIRIGAQLYLNRFYHSLGFRDAGFQYLEDGIPHIEMIYSKEITLPGQ